jgi:hypothetical protein
MNRAHRGSQGQATVEFGISAIVLLLLLLGLIDLGRAFYFAVGFRGAAREGARQASWFDPATGTNPGLDDGAIKGAVDAILRKSGLAASTLANSGGATCPTPADSNTSHNPPYVGTAYNLAGANQPILYICYANTSGLDLASPPSDNSYKGADVNVIVLMNFGLASGFMQGFLGDSLHVVANTHMTIGGY